MYQINVTDESDDIKIQPGTTSCSRTRNSANPSRASRIFSKGAQSKNHPGQSTLMKIPVPTISTQCLKVNLCPSGASLSSQLIWRPKPAAEIVMSETLGPEIRQF